MEVDDKLGTHANGSAKKGETEAIRLPNKKGFTLIEVLLSVSLMAVGMAAVLGGYREILGAYGRVRLLSEGINLLEEKMIDRELEIKTGSAGAGSDSGREKTWNWSTVTKATEQEGWYEITGEIQGEGRSGKISLYRYVRQ